VWTVRSAPLALLTTVLLLAVAAPAAAFELQPLPGPFGVPVFVTGPPGDPDRVMVVQRDGTIRLIKGGANTLFLDITAAVDDGGGEEGLLSMAFAPDYATSRRFYVAYTVASVPAGNDLVVEERIAAASGDTATAEGNQIIRVEHRAAANHNGGQLQFGPDGNLWISTGDGGSGYDPPGNAQNPEVLNGKLLRITPTPGGGYTIPPGNPYSGGGGQPEIWALGLRNPWRFSFDRVTGDLLIGDVGQDTVEEVDRAAAPDLGCGDN